GKQLASLGKTVSTFNDRITSAEQQSREALGKVNGFDQRITNADAKAELALDGVALAMALADPTLTGDASFGLRVNWGNYAGHDAFGVSAVGILDRNVFGNGETFGLAGAIGATEEGEVGGRIGAQLTWREIQNNRTARAKQRGAKPFAPR
ncbi:MAG: hypothetical protein ABL897_02185, partial [Hyphomicrobium sp.]